jgi:hypothetical protein
VVFIVKKKKVLMGEAVQFSCFFLFLHIIVGAKNLLMCACFVACPVQYQKGKRGGKSADRGAVLGYFSLLL